MAFHKARGSRSLRLHSSAYVPEQEWYDLESTHRWPWAWSQRSPFWRSSRFVANMRGNADWQWKRAKGKGHMLSQTIFHNPSLVATVHSIFVQIKSRYIDYNKGILSRTTWACCWLQLHCENEAYWAPDPRQGRMISHRVKVTQPGERQSCIGQHSMSKVS